MHEIEEPCGIPYSTYLCLEFIPLMDALRPLIKKTLIRHLHGCNILFVTNKVVVRINILYGICNIQ